MNKPTIALLIDLSSLRVSCEGFQKLLGEIEKKYEVVYVKFYSYVAKRNRDFNEYIAAKGYEAVTPIASKRRNKLDSRQIIDATMYFVMGSSVDAVGFAYGEGDIIPIVSELKRMGKQVIEIGVEQGTYSSVFNDYVPVSFTYLRDGYTAPTVKREKKAPKPVAPKENAYAAEVNRIFEGRSILNRYKK